jgi:hypothetical protein
LVQATLEVLPVSMGAERDRLEAGGTWRKWGPYVTERQWGTVREDYSPDGSAWDFVTHDMARSKAYRWGEEGIAGICDNGQRLCVALALWNGRDAILKERMFGLSGPEGNHGEDVKEYYFYLDATPTHSYLKMLYKYPQGAFPYAQLLEENRRRGKDDPEFELIDSDVLDGNRYFDVVIEYAKATPEDILARFIVYNRGPEMAEIHLLPQVWFRNTWAFDPADGKPSLRAGDGGDGWRTILAEHAELGRYVLCCDGQPELLFCDNETNNQRFYGLEGPSRYPKDAINDRVVGNNPDTVNPEQVGTKAAAWYRLRVAARDSAVVRLRLRDETVAGSFEGFDGVFRDRIADADEFYGELQANIDDADRRLVQRQALAGMLWSTQFYYYDIMRWLNGDPGQPPPLPERKHGRNAHWDHLNNADIISMPDTWEYPWYAAWDLAFHCIPLTLVDPEFAKSQLVLITREWYMHPNGQLPAYEWGFDDVNPPVHAWAAWRVFQIDRKRRGGKGDLAFLERVFLKLLLNFTWWVNRKDVDENNIFQGGFLGLDNIGIFDRSKPLPGGGHINQADATSWMAMYSLNLMRIALELALSDHAYEDIATKFFEHFLYIARAMTKIAGDGVGLWDEEDGFYYDVLATEDRQRIALKIRSLVGLIPLFAVEVLEPELLRRLPEFTGRLEWVMDHRPELAALVSRWHEPGRGERRLLSLLRGHRMKCLLQRMLDPAEFLSDHGVRSLSRVYRDHPYSFQCSGRKHEVRYAAAESDSDLFGGNSNWRGPVWFPVNYLLIESLHKFHHYYGDDFKIECPTGSGTHLTILEVAEELSRRLVQIFLRDAKGRRAVFGGDERFNQDPCFRDFVPFYEYFDGDSGRGLGASHQTGWTGLVAKLLQPRRPPH